MRGIEKRKHRAYIKLQEETDVLNRVVYKSKNCHRSAMVFKKLVHLKRLCNSFLHSRAASKVAAIRRASEDLYVLATANIPDGYFVGYTLIILGLCSRIHYVVREVECVADRTDTIDDMFAEIE